jgi:hypothetical protein
LLSFVYVARDFSNACALVSSELYWGFMVWVWMDGIFLAFEAFCLPLFELFINLSWKYSRVERYQAAKIGTIYLDLVWWVFFITCD